MALNLLDLYTINVGSDDGYGQSLVFDVDKGIGAIDTFALEVEPDMEHEGDMIVRIPADVWAQIPADTVDEPESDIGSLDWLHKDSE